MVDSYVILLASHACSFSFLCFLLQKSTEKSDHSSKRRCPSCRTSLRETWDKVLCRHCIEDLVKEKDAERGSELAATVKELSSTFQSFKDLFAGFQLPQSSPSPAQQAIPPSLMALPSGSRENPGDLREDVEEEQDSAASDSQKESEGEGKEGKSSRNSRYKLSLEEVDDLLGAIHATLGISEEKKALSLYDLMFASLGEQKKRVFPVHEVLVNTVKKEWQDPERKPFFSKALKRRFPFSEEETLILNKVPKLDAAFSQVSRHTDLAFEDMGVLSDPMDKRMDSLLKKSWESSQANLKPAMAATVVARNMEHWLTQLKAHIEAGTPKETVLASFTTLLSGIAYLADASAESIRMSARSSALSNSARRALWLKTWQGDNASKVKLCGIPLTGDLLFGPGLEAVLDRTADRKKAFPIKKKFGGQTKKKFWPQKKTEIAKPEGKKKFWGPKGKGRGAAIFRAPERPQKSQ